MDDRPPNGPGTTDPSSASKRNPALQSRVLRRSPSRYFQPAVNTKAPSENVTFSLLFQLYHGCRIVLDATSFTSPSCCQAGQKERAFISYLFAWTASHPPPCFRRFTRSVPAARALRHAEEDKNTRRANIPADCPHKVCF